MKSKYNEKIAELLKELRLEKNLRQIDLAKKLDEPQSYVSKYEKAEKNLDVYQLKCICSALDISLVSFVKRLEE